MQENIRRQEQQKAKSKQAEQPESQQGKLCPLCKHINPASAKFCEECGASLDALQCPHCKAEVYPDADICEKCGMWLLPGKCRFCYGELSDDDQFCPECGNPAKGIKCPNCGENNHFDFCTKCNTPLTEAAAEALDQLKNDPQIGEAIKGLEEIRALEKEIEEELQKATEQQKSDAEKEAKLNRLRNLEGFYKKSGNEQPKEKAQSKPQSLFGAGDEKRLDAVARKKAELDARKKQMLEKLENAQDKTFDTQQKARCFYNAIKPPGNLVWECNYVHAIHPAPHDCAKPNLGGKWIVYEGHIHWEYGSF